MKVRGFRQANAWLHNWTGLLLGWLLYAIFLTGTLCFFQNEITLWMKPEQHGSHPDAGSAERAWATLQRLAPTAEQWRIQLPGERNTAIQVNWNEPGQEKRHALTLDAASGEPLEVRETLGGQFFYRFHFQLFGIDYMWGRWIVCIATMLMLVAIVSGVIVHKKIFQEFFTFRPGKSQRAWLDAHNATAVLALPFHLMITYSGLLLFMYMLMPWGMQSVYQNDTRRFFSELFPRDPVEANPAPMQNGVPLTDLRPLLDEAERHWPRGVGSIEVRRPGTELAVIELRELGGDSLLDRGAGERLRFDGTTGEPLDIPPQADGGTAKAVYNVLTGLHLLRFAGVEMRWFFFLSGLLGTAMIATGLVLWVGKRLPKRRKSGTTPFGHRLVEVLNVGTVAGLPVAIAAYFWANRLLPLGLAQRIDWEIRCLFIAWALCLVHPLLRSYRRAWIEQLALASLLYAGLPLLNLSLPDSHLLTTLAHGQWLVAGMDLTLLALAALFGLAAWKLTRLPSSAVQNPTRKAPQEAPI